MNILIVEDEMLIAETIKIYLEERGHQVVNIVISYEEALTALQYPNIDLVLIDVRIYGEKSGIDIAMYMHKNINIPFVYLTSQFDKRVIESAKKTRPQGYVTKPISKETLWTTIEIALENHQTSKEKEEDIVSFVDSGKTTRIKANQIKYIKAEHVYANIYTTEKKYIFRASLNQILDKLNPKHFIQCHRSYIVNKSKINSFSRDTITIENIEIPVSRSRKKMVLDHLENDM